MAPPAFSKLRPANILQVLGITWAHDTHHSKDGRRPEAEQLVRDHYDNKNLGARGVENAEVKSTFHGGDGNKKEHITVAFTDAEGRHREKVLDMGKEKRFLAVF